MEKVICIYANDSEAVYVGVDHLFIQPVDAPAPLADGEDEQRILRSLLNHQALDNLTTAVSRLAGDDWTPPTLGDLSLMVHSKLEEQHIAADHGPVEFLTESGSTYRFDPASRTMTRANDQDDALSWDGEAVQVISVYRLAVGDEAMFTVDHEGRPILRTTTPVVTIRPAAAADMLSALPSYSGELGV